MNASDPQWTVDQLAQRTGMTVRNIRAHQSRGLVAPPSVRGRTGYYGQEHEARIELIQELQSEGFNLEAIRRLLEASPGDGEEPLRFLRAVYAPYGSETPQPVTGAQLLDDWGPDGPALLDRVVALGIVQPTEDGSFVYPSPALIRAARQVVELGIPLERQLELVEAMRQHLAGIAEAFVGLFIEQVWQPFQAEGSPDDRWQEMHDKLERLRPLTGEVLQSVFATAMAEASEAALGSELMGKIGAERDPA